MGYLISFLCTLIFSFLWRKVNLKYDTTKKYIDDESKTLAENNIFNSRIQPLIFWSKWLFGISIFVFSISLIIMIQEKMNLEEDNILNKGLTFLGVLGGIGLGIGLTKYFQMEGIQLRMKEK